MNTQLNAEMSQLEGYDGNLVAKYFTKNSRNSWFHRKEELEKELEYEANFQSDLELYDECPWLFMPVDDYETERREFQKWYLQEQMEKLQLNEGAEPESPRELYQNMARENVESFDPERVDEYADKLEAKDFEHQNFELAFWQKDARVRKNRYYKERVSKKHSQNGMEDE